MLEKIKTAAKMCLDAGAKGYGDYPFERMRAFLYTLRADPNWTDGELMEVQMYVIRAMTSRLVGLERVKKSTLQQVDGGIGL